MHRTGIHQVGKTQLTNTVQPLYIRMLQYIIHQFVRKGQKTEDRIVNYLAFISHSLKMRAKILLFLQSYVEKLTLLTVYVQKLTFLSFFSCIFAKNVVPLHPIFKNHLPRWWNR